MRLWYWSVRLFSPTLQLHKHIVNQLISCPKYQIWNGY